MEGFGADFGVALGGELAVATDGTVYTGNVNGGVWARQDLKLRIAGR